jgi:hypothetical protein
MRPRLAASTAEVAGVVVLASYLRLSGFATRPVTIGEYSQFSRAILAAAVLHAPEGGGPRAVTYAAAALGSPLRTHGVS